MKTRHFRVLAAAMAVSLLLTGCGGRKKPAPQPAPSSSAAPAESSAAASETAAESSAASGEASAEIIAETATEAAPESSEKESAPDNGDTLTGQLMTYIQQKKGIIVERSRSHNLPAILLLCGDEFYLTTFSDEINSHVVYILYENKDGQVMYLPEPNVYATGMENESIKYFYDTVSADSLYQNILDNWFFEVFNRDDGYELTDSSEMDYNGSSYRYDEFTVEAENAILRYLYDEKGDLIDMLVNKGDGEWLSGGVAIKKDESTIEPSLFWIRDGAQEVCYYKGSFYQFVDEPCTWTEAKAACEQRSGNLGQAFTTEIQDLFLRLSSGGRAENVWIGGYRESGSKWKWINPAFPSIYEESENWDANQPDNYGGNEDYLRYANVSKDYGTWSCVAGKWNDTANEGDADAPISSFGYICEWQLSGESLNFWAI